MMEIYCRTKNRLNKYNFSGTDKLDEKNPQSNTKEYRQQWKAGITEKITIFGSPVPSDQP